MPLPLFGLQQDHGGKGQSLTWFSLSLEYESWLKSVSELFFCCLQCLLKCLEAFILLCLYIICKGFQH